ncbi:amidohydrolase family protein [Sphingomonas lenta]|uniref:Amidohydrolase n=1 Tax=Sphingomonas lenta TaxID=1141887 RepID=A0A2A2SC60_9SPHN|nr:amidohydrolase family protein [Sphingomonas lenta]PAX06780.1 amidohydrolase [Sphingomonas lenta]
MPARPARQVTRAGGALVSADEENRMPADLSRLEPPPADLFVIDAVVHPLNLDRANVASRYGEQLWQMSYGLHRFLSPPDRVAPQSVYMTDMRPDLLARTMFEETRTDVAVTHTLRLDSWFRDGFVAEAKTVEMVRDNPGRVLGYVGLDPTGDRGAVLDDLEAQVERLPGAIGVKLYPHQMDPYRRWHADDEVVTAVIERARDLGIRTIAIHKALPNGSVPLDPYRVGTDLEVAADAFPDMNFEIIHSGMAFVEETAMAVGRFPNVYANLETTTALLYQAPQRFAAALALLLQWGGPEKILWGTGCTVVHPQHLIELFWNLELDERTQEMHGVPPLSPEVKRLILAGNYARMTGLSITALQERHAGDRYARARTEGLKAPWSCWAGTA